MTIQSHDTDHSVELEVLISTYGRDGIERTATMSLPRMHGVRYIVSWQRPVGDVPLSLLRDDVVVVNSRTIGLSNNRNDAFDASSAQVVLIADDDIEYTADGLRGVIEAMSMHPEVDLATFRHDGADNKTFPDYEFDLRDIVKNYYVTSFEIAVRRHVFDGECGVRFDTRFGIGAGWFEAGEEELFVHDVMSRGYCCRFFPHTVATHPGLTTFWRHLTPCALRAQGAVIGVKHNAVSSLARMPLVAWRHSRARRYPFIPALWYMLRGWIRGR